MTLRRTMLSLGALAAACLLQGCLEREIVVTSDPPGAIVWLNDQEIGRTPVSTGFTFYGEYDVRLHLAGYEPVVTSRPARAPIYERVGVDLLAEAVPVPIRTRFQWHFTLVKLPTQEAGASPPGLREELLRRAAEARGQVEAGAARP